MAQFEPSTEHMAAVPITIKPGGLPCIGELYLVSGTTKAATSGEIAFTSTGAAQAVAFPITMPTAEGTYQVYIDILSQGQLIGAFVALEDVTVVSGVPPAPPFAYSGITCSCPNEPGSAWHYFIVSVTIRNISSSKASAYVSLRRYYEDDPTDITRADRQRITLDPGASALYEYDSLGLAHLTTGETVHFYYDDDKGGVSSECTCRT